MPVRKKTGKNAPILSHDFIITNHGDIISCICMTFMVGLMFKATNKLAVVFISPQHNVTRTVNGSDVLPVMYTNGPKDFCTIFFYALAWIVLHAVIQEYIWDKITRKLHVSKTKHSKFNDSGSLLPFYIAAVVWGADIIIKHQFVPNISKLWEGYPHNEMTFVLKLCFLIQIAHWVHCFPELYFTKAKRVEIFPKVQLYIEYLFFIWAAYMLNFTRVALCCLTLHYAVEIVFHSMRLLRISGKQDIAEKLFIVWSVLFVVVRLAIIALIVMTFWYGLPRLEHAGFNINTGNFNTPFIRMTAMSASILMQAWLAWNFIRYQIKLWREHHANIASPSKKKEAKKKAKKDMEKKKKRGEEAEEEEEESAEEEEKKEMHTNGSAKHKKA